MSQPVSVKLKNIQTIDRVAYLLATGFGAGLAPKAPGTFGALESVATFCLMFVLHLSGQLNLILLIAFSLLSYVVGVWSANRVCNLLKNDDPKQVVIDEINGQFIAFIPLAFNPTILGIVIAFALFRLFDIFKPYPIRKIEHLHGGFGVMSDDTLAGVYAAVLVWLGHYFTLF